MGLLVFGIIIIITGFVIAAAIKNSYTGKKFAPFVTLTGFILGIIVIAVSCFATVPTGHTGILTTFGKVENMTYEAGVHFKLPWQQVVNMDNRVQKITKNMSAFSSDIQEVDVVYTLNYRIESTQAQNLYKTVGTKYEDTIINAKIEDAVKTVTAKYTAEGLISSRAELGQGIEALLTSSLAPYNIIVNSTAIENLDFTDEFTNAVEAKQVAEQQLKKATTEQEQVTMEKEAELRRNELAAESAANVAKTQANAAADVAKIAAAADLEVQKINADAAEYAGQKEAAKNKVLSENLTDTLLQYFYIMQWNGELPDSYIGSDNVSTILDITGNK